MINLASASLFFLAAGIFTSVTVLSGFQVLFVIAIVYFGFHAIKEKQARLPTSAYWLLAFTGVALLSLIVNFDIIPKPSKNFGRLKYFIFGIGGIFVLRAWIKEASFKTKRFITNTFLVSIIISASYAFWFAFNEKGVRVKSLTDTMRYGYGIGMILLPLLSCILHREKIKDWFNWHLGTIAFLFGFSGMYLTKTRGAMLGFLCGLPFVLYFYSKKLGYTLGGIIFAGVLSLCGMYLFGSGNYESRFLVNKNNPVDVIRMSQWKAAVIAVKEKPILGWGLSNFHSQLKRIKLENNLEAKHYDNAHSHNLFLEIASGTGIVGLLLFLGWITCWAVESFRSSPLMRALIVPFGIAFVVSSQFEVTFDTNNASMIFMLFGFSLATSNPLIVKK